MRTISDSEVEKRDCTVCIDYRGHTMQTQGRYFRLHVCKYSEGCPYAIHFSNEDNIGVKKAKKKSKKRGKKNGSTGR